jgi:hypothetical protein
MTFPSIIARMLPTKPLFSRAPEPGLNDVPDMTNCRMGFDFITKVHSGAFQPTHQPSVGDVVIELESCGMGVSVRRDRRWRVTERFDDMVWDGNRQVPYPAVRLKAADGTVRKVLCLECWPYSGIKRTWVWVS